MGELVARSAPLLNGLAAASLVFLNLSFARLLYRKDRPQAVFLLRLSLGWFVNLVYLVSHLIVDTMGSKTFWILFPAALNSLTSYFFLTAAQWQLGKSPYLKFLPISLTCFVSIAAPVASWRLHGSPTLISSSPSIILGAVSVAAVARNYQKLISSVQVDFKRLVAPALSWTLYAYAALQLGAFFAAPFGTSPSPLLLPLLFLCGLALKTFHAMGGVLYAETVLSRIQVQDDLVRRARISVRLSDQLAHEIRTPATELRLRLQEGLRTTRDSLSHEIISLVEQVTNLVEIFQRLQLDQRFEHEPAKRRGTFNINLICDAVIVSLKLTSKPRCSFVKRYTSGPIVDSTEGDLLLIVRNLLKNAMEASLPNQKEVGEIVLTTTVSIAQQVVNLEIIDDGPGIPKGLEERIFEEGFSTKGGSGRGHGLFLVRETCLKNGWKISLQPPNSNLPQGGYFRISFPLSQKT